MKGETERITIRLSVEDVQAMDMFVQSGEFSNRSEVLRRALKDFIRSRAKEVKEGMEARKELQSTMLEIQQLRGMLQQQQEAIEKLMRR